MTVKRMALFILLASSLSVLGFAPEAALAQSNGGRAKAQVRQNVARVPRARTRIRVTRLPPVYPYRLESSIYPVPYTYEYPGPNAVRQCTAWLATEHRLSGTVVVPRTQCWWERP